jgi:seryl-tRNA synthetase
MTEEVQEKAEVQENQEWDKDKQRADMEHANFLKAKGENEKLSAKITDFESKISSLEEQIKVNQQKVEIAELDPLRADVPDLVNQNQKLIQRLKQAEDNLQNLMTKATDYERKELERQQKEQRQETIDKICKPLDKEFGAKYRSKAVKMAEAMVNDGKADSPQDAMDAYLLLTKCYKELVEADKEKTVKEKLPVDTGAGAFSFQGTDIKEGSLDEVMAAMRKSVGRK